MFGERRKKPTSRLRELRGSGYEIAEGQPDIKGWDVRDASGRKYGVVHDLVFDIRAKKVRYMIVNVLDSRELELERRTVLIPIGLAELDTSDDDVIVPEVSPFQLRALPRYDKSNLGGKTERDISTVFGRSYGSDLSEDDDVDEGFYDHDHFNEENMYRRRGDRTINSMYRERREPIRSEEEMDVPVRGPHDAPPPEDLLYNSDGSVRYETDEEYYSRTGRRRR
ncbi:MAG TPA: PRC-barrel domain-containing protein [Flavisolibacter sp.]